MTKSNEITTLPAGRRVEETMHPFDADARADPKRHLQGSYSRINLKLHSTER